MRDSHNRPIEYLRLSLTQRCNFSCGYCGGKAALGEKDELTPGELLLLLRAFAACGIARLRLTGGEPLLRADLPEIVRLASSLPRFTDISLTTNGALLTKPLAKRLKEEGLGRVNISVDSLRPERFEQITGGGRLADVLGGIDAALSSSLTPLHLNVVLTRGVNDDEADDFLNYAKNNPVTVRFIELMPFGGLGEGIVPNGEILQRHPELLPVKKEFSGQPSCNYTAPGWKGAAGFISPVTEKFCSVCNRVRVLADGSLKPCLGSGETTALKPLLHDREKLEEAIRAAVRNKASGHHFERGCSAGCTLRQIGG